ncbi:TetR/AcrR family transcriptional regulator [Microcella sp.]|uniref:TetR/AcrR family transcriptional regulator n=1 Tax=Microcella sp. TaxID=1913979 RepID=UPI00256AD765|nr:TetR/AcrR family transcriptional regulator [Microcella sp.]MBX9472831.1 TetR/AcrR family transcriptional regulator [Microcella sp.]
MPAPVPADRILDAVLDVWRERGYEASTTAEIARRAGIGEVTLFRRFGDKAGMFAAAMVREASSLRDSAPTLSGDVEADLLAVATAYDGMIARNAAIIIDFLRFAPGVEGLAALAPSPLIAINQLARVIEHHQRAGALGGDEPHTELAELLGPIFLKRLLAEAQPGVMLTNDLESLVAKFLEGRRA